METYTRTDLACEAPETAEGHGVYRRAYQDGDIRIEEMRVTAGEGERMSGRAPGRYVTLHCERIWEMEPKTLHNAALATARVLESFLCEWHANTAHSRVLIAGLGNRFITPDSVGPRTADQITVTNHAAGNALFLRLGCRRVCALAPGVLGQTGLEAAALIAEAARAAESELIVAVDALAARSPARLGATIQISDAGIQPGSGIGNRRAAVTKETMGIPVVAVGVPTVVDSSTLIQDALTQAGIREVDDALEAVLRDGQSYIVSPRESDLIAASAASLLSEALNRTLNPTLL